MKNAIILQAAILGTRAFNSGKKSIPCLDVDLMKLLGTPGIDALVALNAWSDTWHAANICKA